MVVRSIPLYWTPVLGTQKSFIREGIIGRGQCRSGEIIEWVSTMRNSKNSDCGGIRSGTNGVELWCCRQKKWYAD